MNSLEGRCLLASPYLGDSNFYRTALLMVAHTEQGAMGLILNRPTESRVKGSWNRSPKNLVYSMIRSIAAGRWMAPWWHCTI